MHFIIKGTVYFYQGTREPKNTSEIILKEALLLFMWSEDPQRTNAGKVYNPKYLIDSVDETACHELLASMCMGSLDICIIQQCPVLSCQYRTVLMILSE